MLGLRVGSEAWKCGLEPAFVGRRGERGGVQGMRRRDGMAGACLVTRVRLRRAGAIALKLGLL